MTLAAQILRSGWFDENTTVAPLGEGRINQTLLVTAADGTRYVLQRINEKVFSDPALVMNNLARIHALLAQQAPDLIPRLVPTRHGDSAWMTRADGCWRLWRYVEGGRSLTRTTDHAIARSAGGAFGRFQRLLAGLGEPPLEPAIPGFLELPGYLEALDEALTKADAAAALKQVCDGPRFLDRHRPLGDRFPPRGQYIHGDCKLNNLLFHQSTPSVLAVLDLDTVMRGHWAWDFGDLARSVLAGGIRASLFREVVAGFTAGKGWHGDPLDLVEAPRYLAFMLGVRFLTDHLDGDRYFQVKDRGDNLNRASAQFTLVERLEAERESLLTAAAAGLELAQNPNQEESTGEGE